jgi:predicted metal-dependent peptidase
MFAPVPIPDDSPAYDFHTMGRDLDRAKSAVFIGSDAAFFGPLMCSLDFVWAHGSGLETSATDGKTLWWDPLDFMRLCVLGRKATIMHELWHVARLHAVRRGSRCPDVWNIACDIWINRNLLRQGYTLTPPELWVIRPEFDHLEVEEDIYDALQAPGGGGASGPGQCAHGKVQATPQVKQQLMNAVVKAVQSAKMNGQPGAIPGNTEKLIKQFLKSVIPWTTHLQNFFTDLLDEDYTWRRPSRRYVDMYLPARFTDEGRLEHICFYEDVSGSITPKDSLRFNSELKYVWETFQPAKLTIIQFDTIIQKIDVLENSDPFDEIRIVGGGGTSLVEVRKHMMDTRPNAAIVFSDLQVNPMLPGPDIPILWVAIANHDATVPFGKLIHIRN